MRRHIDDHRFVDTLPGKACSAAAGQHRHTVTGTQADQLRDLFDTIRYDYTKRHNLIDRSIRRVESTHVLVEMNLKPDRLQDIIDQSVTEGLTLWGLHRSVNPSMAAILCRFCSLTKAP